ncbi:hypothetical protein N8I74_12050 [Chitiniphilus purpureus]|uniref:Uncharacterized protein n=1 Tax=Chitiniphilus purpureus TaxID=2981137 RepID=A0ABY6DI76_9NEIS|nr:hypothetical protein [Chitiniphilus sp. CD1]UXY14054.1 hypothetical protein N8I74_12050 [Chitiniphilus sp. CD1]
MQDSINWKGVAAGALGTAVTAGIGVIGSSAQAAQTAAFEAAWGSGGISGPFGSSMAPSFNALGGVASAMGVTNSTMGMLLNGMVGNMAMQGANGLTGIQEKFSWRSMATAAITAPVGSRVGEFANNTAGRFGDVIGHTAGRLAQGVVGNLVQRQGKLPWASVAADAFGTSLGDELVGALARNTRVAGVAEPKPEVEAFTLTNGVGEQARVENSMSLPSDWSIAADASEAIGVMSDAGLGNPVASDEMVLRISASDAEAEDDATAEARTLAYRRELEANVRIYRLIEDPPIAGRNLLQQDKVHTAQLAESLNKKSASFQAMMGWDAWTDSQAIGSKLSGGIERFRKEMKAGWVANQMATYNEAMRNQPRASIPSGPLRSELEQETAVRMAAIDNARSSPFAAALIGPGYLLDGERGAYFASTVGAALDGLAMSRAGFQMPKAPRFESGVLASTRIRPGTTVANTAGPRFSLKLDTSSGLKTWVSPEGLRYGPDRDPTIGNRVKHVLLHTEDDVTKSQQGVFSIPRNEILPLTDSAFAKIKIGSSDVVSHAPITLKSGVVRQVHEVEMGQTIGWFGGKKGAAAGNPDVTRLRLVIDNGNNVVSSFPVQ